VILEEHGSTPQASEFDGIVPHVGLLHAAPDDGRIVGTWLYGRRPSRFHISRTQNKGFRFQERFGQEQTVSGILRQRGPWLQATIIFKDGTCVGSIRLRLVEEEPERERLSCCVKGPGEVHWSEEIPARRKGQLPQVATGQPHLEASPSSGSRSPGPVADESEAATPSRSSSRAWGVLPGASWLDVGRACCAAQCQLMVEYAFIDVPPGGAPARIPQHPSELRASLGGEPIVAFTEYRHPVSPPQLGLRSSIWLDHAFAMLEAGADATWAICLEKLSDRLEIMAGKLEAVKAYAVQHRASGQKRPLCDGLPMDERPREGLGPEVLRVSNLCDWIEGPLATTWKSYHPVEANGQHFAYELQAFFRQRTLPRQAPLRTAGIQSGRPMQCHASAVPGSEEVEPGQLGRQLTLRAVQRAGSSLAHAPEHLRADREIVREAVDRAPASIQYAAEELRGDRSFMLPLVQRLGSVLKFAAPALRGDRDVVVEAVRQDGEALKYASQELRADAAVVSTAVKQAVAALAFAEEELRGNRHFILSLVSQDGRALHYTTELLKGDREIVLAAVRQNGMVLEWASREMRADPSVVMAAVQQRGTALRFAAHAFKMDKEIIKAAVNQDWRTLSLAEPSMAASEEVVMTAVRRYWGAFQLASAKLLANRDVILKAVEEDWRTLMFVAKELRSDRKLNLAAVARHGMALQLAPRELQADREVVLIAVQQDYNALSFASDELKGDKDILMAAVKKHWSSLKHASKELQADRELAAVAVRQSVRAFEHIAPCLRSDASLWLLAERDRGPEEEKSEAPQPQAASLVEEASQTHSSALEADEAVPSDAREGSAHSVPRAPPGQRGSPSTRPALWRETSRT